MCDGRSDEDACFIMKGIGREFGINMYTLLYLKWRTSKDLLYSTGNSAQCSLPAWMGGDFGGEWIHVSIWLSPFTVYLKLTALLISYTPVQKKVSKNKGIFLNTGSDSLS